MKKYNYNILTQLPEFRFSRGAISFFRYESTTYDVANYEKFLDSYLEY